MEWYRSELIRFINNLNKKCLTIQYEFKFLRKGKMNMITTVHMKRQIGLPILLISAPKIVTDQCTIQQVSYSRALGLMKIY